MSGTTMPAAPTPSRGATTPYAPRAAAAAAGAPTEAMRAAARRFEAQALGALMNQAFATNPVGQGMLSGGSAEAQWRPLLVDAYAEGWARRGGVGIADAVLREMVRMQAGADAAAAAAAVPQAGAGRRTARR